MPRELPPDAELVPGRYALDVELPDRMLDAINARPNWRSRLVQEINERATANVSIIGAGVAHRADGGRVFTIAFEVIDPYESEDGEPSITVAVQPVVAVAVIVAAVSAVLVVSIGGHYTVRVLDDVDPGQTIGDVTSTAKVWGVVGALAIAAWYLRGVRPSP